MVTAASPASCSFSVFPSSWVCRRYYYLGTTMVTLFYQGYSIYAWAKRVDEYQNSKAGHIAAGGHH
jgi:hypothetical protein